MNPPSDSDATAFVQGLFVKHQPVVRATILAVLPDFDMVDDVVQETFLTVTRKAASFTPGTNFAAWVCTIARFKAMEARRRGPLRFETLSEESARSGRALGAAAG